MRTILLSALTILLCFSLASCVGRVGEDLASEQVAALEARVERVEDASDIRRLQRAYGYYFDKGQWDEVADLFAAGASIEYGNEGVYIGQQRIREYFRELGHDRIGLIDGELNNRLILQPIIHVAADGKTAKGRWRALIQHGQYRQSAFWGEGPYEVEYVKEGGVWKIAKLHWYVNLFVPYEGGWAKSQPMDAWKSAAAQAFKPDRPPTEDYQPWPAAHVAPFHYSGLPTPFNPPRDIGPGLAKWEREVARLEAREAIENLQATYGYYIDEQLWDDAARLFSRDATYEVEQRGVYRGRERVRAALALNGELGPQRGALNIEMQLQPIVHVGADGRSAKARWRTLEMKGKHGKSGQWGGGVQENEYVFEDGEWRISKLHYYLTFRGDYDKGWSAAPLPMEGQSATLPPDAPPTQVYGSLPQFYVPPFHYAHPVRDAQPRAAMGEVPDALEALQAKLAALNDEIEVTHLQRTYGYYVDKQQWDDVADLFAEQSTLEIGGRGVFVGRERVREYMHFLGRQGPEPGRLYEHSQWQPIVTIAADGESAKARLRAFIMGGSPIPAGADPTAASFGKATVFGEATYENEYVRQAGVWKIGTLYAYFNFYSPQAAGWGKVAMQNTRPEADLPPDRPPTLVYDMYPKPTMLQYHYKNPVTGR